MSTTPVVGVDTQAWIKTESSMDTALAFAATDAVAVVELEIEPEQEWHKSKEHVGSATLQTEVEGKRGGKWSCKVYHKINAAGTAPDFNVLLTAAQFNETVGASSATYALGTTLRSLQIGKLVGSGLYEQANGAWVEQVDVEIMGNAEGMLTFSGGFASYGWLFGAPTTNTAGYATGATAITLAAADAYKIGVNARIQFATDTNGGAGYLVTAVSSNGLTITISPGIAGAGLAASSIEITPFLPAFTITSGGTIAGGIANSFSIGGTSVGFISYKCSYKTGIHGLNKEAHTNRANRIARGAREIEASAQFYFLDENVSYLGRAWNGTTAAVVARSGPQTAGQRMKFTMPAGRLAVAKVDVPEAEEATYEAQIVPRKSSANEDEFAIVAY